MKFSFLLFIALVCGAAQAQQAPCLKLHSAKLKYGELHQGSTAFMELVFRARDCYVFNGALNNRVWPTLEITGESGLTSKTSDVIALKFDDTAKAAGLLRAQEIHLYLDLQASPDLRVGEHTLAGALRYQVVDERGNLSDETLDLTKTFKVDKALQSGPGFYERHPRWAKVLLPLEIIALLPLWIVSGLFYPSSC